jgi:hypothetical protein
MTWNLSHESTARARELLDEVGRTLGPMPYVLAHYALVRSGASRSHRELAAGYLNMHDGLLDTHSVRPHS